MTTLSVRCILSRSGKPPRYEVYMYVKETLCGGVQFDDWEKLQTYIKQLEDENNLKAHYVDIVDA